MDVKASPAFEQVLSEHEEIRGLVGDLRDFLTKNRPEIGEEGSHRWAANLSGSLAKLHDQLFRHFRYEDGVGMLDELERHHPGATRKITALRLDHEEILAGVRELMNDTLSYAEGKKPEDARLRARLTGVLDHLGKHEETETDLLQRLEYLDLGTGD